MYWEPGHTDLRSSREHITVGLHADSPSPTRPGNELTGRGLPELVIGQHRKVVGLHIDLITTNGQPIRRALDAGPGAPSRGLTSGRESAHVEGSDKNA
jgi:hypothetical protein